MAIGNINMNWVLGSYAADRNEEIKRSENDLLRNDTGNVDHLDIDKDHEGNPVIGYGYDLFENIDDVAADLPLYLAGGVQISAYQMEAR